MRVGDAICFRHKPFHGDPVVPFVSLQHWHHRKGRRLNTGQPIQPLREVFVYLQTARLWVSIKRRIDAEGEQVLGSESRIQIAKILRAAYEKARAYQKRTDSAT